MKPLKLCILLAGLLGPALMLSAAVNITPNPSDPGNLGDASNRFPKAYIDELDGDATNQVSSLAQAAARQVSGTNSTSGNAATATLANLTRTNAADGSPITSGISGSAVTTGTLPDARLSASVLVSKMDSVCRGKRARILLLGDSYCDPGYSYASIPATIVDYLKLRYGNNGGGGDGAVGNGSSIFNHPEGTNWFSILCPAIYPNDETNSKRIYYSQAMQTSTYRYIATTNPINMAGIFWLAWPKGGTIYVTNSGSAVVPPVTLDGYAPSNTVRYKDIYLGENTTGNNTFPISLSGTNIIIGVDYYNTNTLGVDSVWQSKGSIYLSTMIASGTNNMAVLGAANPYDAIIYYARDDGELDRTTATNYFQSIIRSFANPNTKVFFIAPYPQTEGNTNSIWFNAGFKTICDNNGWTYIDLASDFPSYDAINAAGFTYAPGDIHPSFSGAKAMGYDALGLMGFNTALPSLNAPTAARAVLNNSSNKVTLYQTDTNYTTVATNIGLTLSGVGSSNTFPLIRFESTYGSTNLYGFSSLYGGITSEGTPTIAAYPRFTVGTTMSLYGGHNLFSVGYTAASKGVVFDGFYADNPAFLFKNGNVVVTNGNVELKGGGMFSGDGSGLTNLTLSVAEINGASSYDQSTGTILVRTNSSGSGITSVTTTDSSDIAFTGLGTSGSPLTATFANSNLVAIVSTNLLTLDTNVSTPASGQMFLAGGTNSADGSRSIYPITPGDIITHNSSEYDAAGTAAAAVASVVTNSLLLNFTNATLFFTNGIDGVSLGRLGSAAAIFQTSSGGPMFSIAQSSINGYTNANFTGATNWFKNDVGIGGVAYGNGGGLTNIPITSLATNGLNNPTTGQFLAVTNGHIENVAAPSGGSSATLGYQWTSASTYTIPSSSGNIYLALNGGQEASTSGYVTQTLEPGTYSEVIRLVPRIAIAETTNFYHLIFTNGVFACSNVIYGPIPVYNTVISNFPNTFQIFSRTDLVYSVWTNNSGILLNVPTSWTGERTSP